MTKKAPRLPLRSLPNPKVQVQYLVIPYADFRVGSLGGLDHFTFGPIRALARHHGQLAEVPCLPSTLQTFGDVRRQRRDIPRIEILDLQGSTRVGPQ